MAQTIGKGPGQTELTGDIHDPRDPNPAGTYKDPQSGAESTVTMSAGADALVRMGWVRIADIEGNKTESN